MNELGRRLENLREERGLYKKDVSIMLGFSENVYGAYERGERTPSIDTVKELSILFETTTDYLLTGKEINRPVANDKNYSALHKFLSKKGIENPNILQVEKWSILTLEEILEITEHFNKVYHKAKGR